MVEEDDEKIIIQVEETIVLSQKRKPTIKAISMKIDENILDDIDSEKVGISFSLFVVSQTEPEMIVKYLRDFKLMFRELLMNKTTFKPTDKSDEIPYDYKNIEKEIERKTTRSMVDLETWVDRVSYDWKSFFKVLSDED